MINKYTIAEINKNTKENIIDASTVKLPLELTYNFFMLY
jgi:hypothetical protein